jgi:hypothetical protein
MLSREHWQVTIVGVIVLMFWAVAAVHSQPSLSAPSITVYADPT